MARLAITERAVAVRLAGTLGVRRNGMRTELNRKTLAGASVNADKAFQAVSDEKLGHVPVSEKTAWAMAAVIHCDFCRLVIAYEECEREGLASLLWIADISSKLFEARNWYSNTGTKLLREIATTKSGGVAEVNKEIEQLKKSHQIHRINKYEDYRNKFGYHYDENAIAYLQKFGGEDAKEFLEILVSFVKFSGEWAQLTKNLIKTNAA
jgi:hypothetical protein